MTVKSHRPKPTRSRSEITGLALRDVLNYVILFFFRNKKKGHEDSKKQKHISRISYYGIQDVCSLKELAPYY